MALTNSEKSILRWSVKDFIRKGYSEKQIIERLRGNYKISTIKAYYKTFSPSLSGVLSQGKEKDAKGDLILWKQ
jgi:hypothetical protein